MLGPYRRGAVVAAPAAPVAYYGARYLYGAARSAYREMKSRPAPRPMKRRRYGNYSRTKRSFVPRSMPYKRIKRRRTYKCKVKKLCKFMKQQQAVHLHRRRESRNLIAAEKQTNLFCWNTGGNMTEIQVAMASLRFYDPSTNALVTNDLSSGTYARDVSISIARKIMLRNNYHIDVYVQVWSCTPKESTNVDALQCYNSGLVDQGNPSNQSPLIQFKDSLDLKNLWTCKLMKKGTLKPGESFMAKSFAKQFEFNISTFDEQTEQYQKSQGGHCWVVRIVGAVAHDTVTFSKVGVARSAIDVLVDAETRITYDAGKDLHDISVVDNSDPLLNAGRVSHQPVAAQQGYLG